MDYILTQFLLVAIIFSLLLIYVQVKELAPKKKRKYKHKEAYLLARKFGINKKK